MIFEGALGFLRLLLSSRRMERYIMIKISENIVKKQTNFWNGCVFHPTDAVEDPWGRRILDKMAEDRAIRSVRLYAMLEDIVYLGENGELCYDFRLSDLRLDYMVEKGYDLIIAYAGIPDCIASSNNIKTSVSKNKTRYKGKMWNGAPPRDYGQWEQICYEYTKHIIERYGIDRVKEWRLQCFNEPDIGAFFLGNMNDGREAVSIRCREYCKLYESFARGVSRASLDVKIGGPALAYHLDFLGGWLDFVKEKGLKLDFISAHHYGTGPNELNSGKDRFCVDGFLAHPKRVLQVIAERGFDHLPFVMDEWGMASHGFFNREECPAMMARETEVFSSYFVKLIYKIIESDIKMENLMICLSGQHEMVEDFSGFRNFFTLNFIKKPIYNAFILASRLGEGLISADVDNEKAFLVPTKRRDGSYSILLSYSNEFFDENIPEIEETLIFDEDISDKKVTVWCIDREHTNPYRLFEKLHKDHLDSEDIALLRHEGNLVPLVTQCVGENIVLKLTANCTYLVEVE